MSQCYWLLSQTWWKALYSGHGCQNFGKYEGMRDSSAWHQTVPEDVSHKTSIPEIWWQLGVSAEIRGKAVKLYHFHGGHKVPSLSIIQGYSPSTRLLFSLFTLSPVWSHVCQFLQFKFSVFNLSIQSSMGKSYYSQLILRIKFSLRVEYLRALFKIPSDPDSIPIYYMSLEHCQMQP